MDKYTSIKDIPTITYLIVFILGVWGTFLSYIKRENDGTERTILKKLTLFLTDLITTVGLSIITFYGAIGSGLNEILSVGLSGFVAHQGTRAIYLVELVIADKVNSNSLKEELSNKGNK